MGDSGWTMNDWVELWQLGLEKASALWLHAAPAGATPPLDDAVQAFSRFADGVRPAFVDATEGDLSSALADYLESLLDAGDDARLAPWMSTPAILQGVGPWATVLRTVGEHSRRWQDDWLERPAFGPAREWTEAVQAVTRAALDMQAATEDLLAHQQHATRAALRQFIAFLRERDGEPIKTLRALYERWLDIADEAFKTHALTDAYAGDLGRWFNARGDLARSWGELAERGGEALGTPTLDSIESLGRQNQELRDELERLRAEIEVLKSTNTATPMVKRRAASPAKKASRPTASPSRKPRRASRTAKREQARPDEFDISRIVDAAD